MYCYINGYEEKGFEPDFRLKMDLEAQSRGLDKAPPPEPSSRSMPSPDNVWQRSERGDNNLLKTFKKVVFFFLIFFFGVYLFTTKACFGSEVMFRHTLVTKSINQQHQKHKGKAPKSWSYHPSRGHWGDNLSHNH